MRRRFLPFAPIGFASLLLVTGCGTAPTPDFVADAPSSFYASGFYDREDMAYETAVDMGAPADWTDIEFGVLSLRVPYSPAWTVERKPLLPVSPPEPGDTPGVSSLSFGRFIQRASMIREYALSFTRLEDGDDPLARTENECPDLTDDDGRLVTLPPATLTIGNVTAVSYLVGDAGSCSTNVDFALDGQVITLTKVPAVGEEDFSHAVTPEMRAIIEGVRVR